MSSAVSLISLRCRACGGTLPACENDVLFACEDCGSAWELAGGSLASLPLLALAPLEPGAKRPDIYLPVWRTSVSLKLESDNPSHRSVLAQAMAMKHLFVTAFTVHGLHAFGDPGLAFSQAQVEAPAAEGLRPLVLGGDRGRREAWRWLPLTVLHLLSRRLDVSEVRMSMRHGEETLCAVPFYNDGDHWRDGMLGGRYPKRALLDGARIEAFWKKRAARGMGSSAR